MRVPWRRKKPEPPAGTPVAPAAAGFRIAPMALDGWQAVAASPWRVAEPMPGVVPADKRSVAMDAATPEGLYAYAAMNSQGAGISFPGFPLLAELAQRAEYRHITHTMAREMTRKWAKVVSTSGDDIQSKVDRLNELMDQHDLAGLFRTAAMSDGFFGRGHIYIEIDNEKDNNAALLPRASGSIPKGAKVRFQSVEPLWTYPAEYNASDPLSREFYAPQTWYVMGQQVHRSRLHTLISRPMPDMLKPAYGFAGLSLSQMAIPYVQNWLRTRQSVSDMLHTFSVTGLATNMGAVLQGGGADSLLNRAMLFNQARDNRGLMLFDHETEDLKNVSAPLSTLDSLQAQSQEHMASVSGIPLVKLLGITPSGLNVSSDGEIRSFYDTVDAAKKALFQAPLLDLLGILQLAEFGSIDASITVEWGPLWQLDEAGEAAVRKTDADSDAIYIQSGVLSPEEVRERIAHAPGSGYSNIDVSDVPDPPEASGGGMNDPETNRLDERAEAEGGEISGM